ncbi:virulence factor MviN [Zobellia amurskyensis]|uniref:Virulence factor MviN n=1 Tax=Zobellia amurskyensis TaxID=248905 RepID=A0A7X2ZV10_9FLAO|nr:lipid II flippase MurJ [Zobellia amurskyensis]MUH36915.1 virulence factor MviN [Zobellia amurskyensis]
MKIPSYKKIISEGKKKLINPIVANVIIVGTVVFAIKIISFYKETLVASFFGLSLLLDTFLIAILIPSFIQNFFIGALQNIFIPNYITEIKNKNNKAPFQTLVFCIVAAIMLFFTSVTYLSSDYFIEFVFPEKDLEFYNLVRTQLFIIVPSLFFMGFGSIISSLLEIQNKFLISTLSGLFPAISTIITLVFFKNELGNYVLAVGFLSGVVISFLYLLFFGIKHKVIHISRPSLNDNSRIMLRQLPAKLTSGFLVDINPFVDQFFAGQLAIGAISALNYGMKIPAFVTSIVVIALGNVILPYFSRIINENIGEAYDKMFKIMKFLFLTSLILVLILIFYSTDIISLLFERDSFNKDDTILVGTIQQILLLYVPFKVSGVIMVKFLTTINQNVFMAWMSFISVIINLTLNIILVEAYGIFGLALSTTLVLIVRTIVYYCYTRNLHSKLI